jgi:hypothetical protein
MISYLLYNRNTSGERKISELARRLEREDVATDLLDADSPRGVQFAESYDLMGRPAAILIKDDGAPMQSWQGEDQIPSPSDIGYLAHQ